MLQRMDLRSPDDADEILAERLGQALEEIREQNPRGWILLVANYYGSHHPNSHTDGPTNSASSSSSFCRTLRR
jgi:hypothetical protein